MRLLETGARQEEIATFRRQEIEDHFGLNQEHSDLVRVAIRINEWFSQNWKGSKV